MNVRRVLLFLFACAVLPPLEIRAEQPVIVIDWKPTGLSAPQRAFCESFAREAVTLTSRGEPAAARIEGMRRQAAAARGAGLGETAAYLERVCEAATGGPTEAAETAFKATEHEPVMVLVRVQKAENGESPFGDVIVGIRDPDDAWLDALERRLGDFEKTLPGYRADWKKSGEPHGVSYLGGLVARAGAAAQSTSPASYPPFDAELRPKVGRSWIHWKNMMSASWFEREIRPTAAAALDPGVLARATGDGQVRWYALRYVVSDAGPQVVNGQPLKAVLGDEWGPIVISKADVTATLADQWLARVGLKTPVPLADDLASLVAVELHTLNDVVKGEAPPQHKPASCLTLNWCLRAGGIVPGKSGWTLDEKKMKTALESLTKELLELESAGDRDRAKKLLAEYGSVTPDIQTVLDKLPPPKAPKALVRYLILEHAATE
jgi:hypothetical protein